MSSPKKYAFALLLMSLGAFPALSQAQRQSQAPAAPRQIKQQIIDESIAAYPGNCPCPYNVMRNGRSCGGRSAWSRQGGHAPICYEREVTLEMVRERQGQPRAQARQENPDLGQGAGF